MPYFYFNMNTSVMYSILIFFCSKIWVTDGSHIVYERDLQYEPGYVNINLNENENENEDYQKNLMNSYSEESTKLEILSISNWPSKNIKLGAVSGVSLDNFGNVYVFHRGNIVWDVNSFLPNNTYNEIYLGPISEPTVYVIHPETGAILHQWGSNIFYLPHGITVDQNNNVWVTDVALHQVFKFPPLLDSKLTVNEPLLELGSRFVPGNSLNLFCKPTAVAVLPSGEFFVADGYCNSRIIKFAPDGKSLLTWGRSTLTSGYSPDPPKPYHFNIPHDLTLLEKKNLLCVSDRENGRILCFSILNGTFVYQIESKEIGSQIFSAYYTPSNGGLFYVVNGKNRFSKEAVYGSVVDANPDQIKVIKKFQPANTTFNVPHDVIVSRNGQQIYVAELSPARIWKFKVRLNTLQISNLKMGKVLTSVNAVIDNKSSSTALMAILITSVIMCFGAVLLAAALIYSKTRTRGCSGHCKNAKWLIGKSSGEGFKLGNFLGQNEGFIKLNNFEESDEDEANVSSTFA